MSLTPPIAMTRVVSPKVVVMGRTAVSGFCESVTSTMRTRGGTPSARYSSASRLPPSRSSTDRKRGEQATHVRVERVRLAPPRLRVVAAGMCRVADRRRVADGLYAVHGRPHGIRSIELG